MGETNVDRGRKRQPDSDAAYLVRRHKGEYGPVFELERGKRLGIGRADSNFIVLRDDGCSRNHAELFFSADGWSIQDLGSLNGTRVNQKKLSDTYLLQPGDVINVGQTELVYVPNREALRQLRRTSRPQSEGGISVRRRQNQTQILMLPDTEIPRTSHRRDLQILYRLALQMGQCKDTAELANAIFPSLRQATAADSAALLRLDDHREPVVLGHHVPEKQTYMPPSLEVIDLVRNENEAVLAEDRRAIGDLAEEGSGLLSHRTMICAPVCYEGQVIALLHLYTSDPLNVLTSDDLDLATAVAQQLGPVLHGLERQSILSSENQQLRETLRVETELIGQSEAINRVIEQIGMVAPTTATVLIRGESGVGKELVARSIHFSSPRSDGPFVCLNCAALPESLLESELFGHEKGSFTGATEKKRGKFEVAHQGTIFLDEIGELTLPMQSKLLRILDGHSFERVGGDKPIRVNVRVVAATNRDLEAAVAEGQFRRDLYYRLHVVEIRVPPLCERLDDVPVLAEHFMRRFADEMGRKVEGFSADALKKLRYYHWPGNVRELKNVIERTLVLSRNSIITADDIWLNTTTMFPSVESPYVPVSLADLEAEHIARTLEFTHWNKSQAASILGIERSTLDRKLKRYEIVETNRDSKP